MKALMRITEKFHSLFTAIFRYPLGLTFFFLASVVNFWSIENESDNLYLFFTFLIGAFWGIVMEAVWERFFKKLQLRLLLNGLAIISALVYYFLVISRFSSNPETQIRTIVAVFVLFMAFIWIPTIRNPKEDFNQRFMAVFKLFFSTLLFSGVLLIGMFLIVAAIDILLFSLPETVYLHILNLIGMIFSPMFFLASIPFYDGALKVNISAERREFLQVNTSKAFQIPRFLEILLSYVVIPLLTLYTFILLIYIAINVRAEFWQDNLLEPMLVGFSITVIFVYFLVSQIENKFTVLYRKVFPMLLVPIAIFQIIASAWKIQDTGITFTRYDVILYGIFAVIAGVLFNIMPIRKNGYVCALLIIFLMISIIPPFDAFTVSRKSQTSRLVSVLNENQMLTDGMIIPNSQVNEDDQRTVASATEYLWSMGYSAEIDFLGENFNFYSDFYEIFGFNAIEKSEEENLFLSLNQEEPININSYDQLMMIHIYQSQSFEFEKDGRIYRLVLDSDLSPGTLKLYDKSGNEIQIIEMIKVFKTLVTEDDVVNSKNLLSPEEVTVVFENEQSTISFIPIFLEVEGSQDDSNYYGDFYVLVKVK
ncbi:DUF4153 domain-containing protein [Eubacteriaceae bacterium ES3]|nr:DUF4153 domain-containing protein [Eubacteriaceae bacterium ES3]